MNKEENHVYFTQMLNIEGQGSGQVIFLDKDQLESLKENHSYMGGNHTMKWISVKDELPTSSKNFVGRYVLTWSPDYGYKVAAYSQEDDCWFKAYSVTHWMELPDPPKND